MWPNRRRSDPNTLIAEPFGLTAVQAVAAGALPLVHDSGGQRETVPDATLRYTSLDDVPALIAAFEADPQGRRRRQAALFTHVQETFAAARFAELLRPFLETLLAGGRFHA